MQPMQVGNTGPSMVGTRTGAQDGFMQTMLEPVHAPTADQDLAPLGFGAVDGRDGEHAGSPVRERESHDIPAACAHQRLADR
jgi:hypothetical protein